MSLKARQVNEDVPFFQEFIDHCRRLVTVSKVSKVLNYSDVRGSKRQFTMIYEIFTYLIDQTAKQKGITLERTYETFRKRKEKYRKKEVEKFYNDLMDHNILGIFPDNGSKSTLGISVNFAREVSNEIISFVDDAVSKIEKLLKRLN